MTVRTDKAETIAAGGKPRGARAALGRVDSIASIPCPQTGDKLPERVGQSGSRPKAEVVHAGLPGGHTVVTLQRVVPPGQRGHRHRVRRSGLGEDVWVKRVAKLLGLEFAAPRPRRKKEYRNIDARMEK